MTDGPVSQPPPPTKEFYALFAGNVDQLAVQRLANIIAIASQQNVTHLHLAFQTSGGGPDDGVALYNLFRATPIDLARACRSAPRCRSPACTFQAPKWRGQGLPPLCPPRAAKRPSETGLEPNQMLIPNSGTAGHLSSIDRAARCPPASRLNALLSNHGSPGADLR
jgi:hypothetical protein